MPEPVLDERPAATLGPADPDPATRAAHAEAEAAALRVDLDDLTDALAHDLRAPLRQVRTFGAALLEAAPEGRLRGAAEVVADAAERLDRMLRALDEWARLLRRSVHVEPIPLGDVVDAALARVPADAGHVAERGPLEPRVRADRGLLGDVLAALVDNAVAHGAGPTGEAHVRIASERRGGRVRLVVSDRGAGIDAADHARIFRVMTRLDVADVRGVGMGLAFARRAASRMGAALGVDSARGEGSRFWIDLEPG